MNLRILNRAFEHPADGFYHIEAKGYHPAIAQEDGNDVKIVQVIDDKAISSIVNRFNQKATDGTLHHGSEMLIDREHLRHEKNGDSCAYGWTQELAQRPDGVYARNRWTATGKPAVDGGDFRFFSTEYDGPVFQKVSDSEIPLEVRNKYKGYKFLRPLEITGLSLTNQNNNRGQRPITNRDSRATDNKCPECNTTLDATGYCPDCKKNFANASASADSNKINIKNKNMKSVAELLGLSAEASESAILAAVTTIKNRVTELESGDEGNTKLKNRVTELQTANKTLLDEQVSGLFAEHGVKDEKVRNHMTPVLLNLKNREERVATLIDFGFKPVEAGKGGNGTRVLNRSNSTDKQPEINGDEQALAQKAEAEVKDYQLRNRCTYGDARNAVRAAKPELFGLTK